MGTNTDVRSAAPPGGRAPKRGGRGALAGALLLTGISAVCVTWLVLTPPNRVLWLAAFVAREYGLFLIVAALAGLAAALVAWRHRRHPGQRTARLSPGLAADPRGAGQPPDAAHPRGARPDAVAL